MPAHRARGALPRYARLSLRGAQFTCFTGTKCACYLLVQQSTNADTGGEGLQVDDTLSEPILGYYSPEPAGMYEETLAENRRTELKRVLGTHFTCFTGTNVQKKTDAEGTADFIHEGVKTGENVIVHCRLGTNRSVMVAAAYLMIYHRMRAQVRTLAIWQREDTCIG